MKRVSIIGTGLIGGSLGLALRRVDPGLAVVGFDVDRATAARAHERGAVTAIAPSPEDAVEGADVVVLAMPIDRTRAAMEAIADAVGDDAAVTDVGSAKTEVVQAGTELFGDRFVGGHPMAGSERHGIEAADDLLFEGAWWILTPTATTAHRAYAAATALVGRVGATPVAVAPDVHDALIARLSHVPQLTASAIVDVAAAAGERTELMGLAGPGFRDVTRIAASRPDLWVSIIRSNRDAVLDALARLGGRLGDVRAMVEGERWDDLAGFLGAARATRLGLFAKPQLPPEPVEVSLLIPDRPGVLAEVTTAAGRLGANIEELNIVHSTEGGRGRLELVIAGRANAEALADALARLGYHVETAEVIE